jgi:hypothetical protein
MLSSLDNTKSLQVLTVKNILECMDDKDLTLVFEDLNANTLNSVKKVIKSRFNKKFVIYILTFSGETFEYPIHVTNLLSKYYSDLTKIERHDPTLIIICELLCHQEFVDLFGNGNEIPIADYNFNTVLNKHKLNLFQGYEIKDSDDVDAYFTINEYIVKTDITQPTVIIPQRPPDLFAQITEYAQQNNLHVNLRNINDYPVTGPYRIHD